MSFYKGRGRVRPAETARPLVVTPLGASRGDGVARVNEATANDGGEERDRDLTVYLADDAERGY